MGEEALFEKHPKARGYLRNRAGYRLYEKREEAEARLLDAVRNNAEWLKETLHYPIVGG
jgi:hypothetical protein